MIRRQERLEKIFEREISKILLNSKNEKLRFVNVTKVRLTSDVSLATVFYTIIGTESQKESTTVDLNNSIGYIKSSLSKIMEIRRIPDLNFKVDESIEYGERIENIIKGFKK